MLVNYFYRLVGSNPVYNWIRSVTPQRRPQPPHLEGETIVFPFASGGSLTWTDVDLLDLLHRTNPRFTVPLLWELCLCYDQYYESSEILRKYCKTEIGSSLEGVGFYRELDKLKLCCWSKKPPRTSPDIDVFVDKKKLVVTLQPTDAVHQILVDHLAESVLGIQADCLWQLLKTSKKGIGLKSDR